MEISELMQIELDPYEARALRFSAGMAREAMAVMSDHKDLVPLPEGRSVYPLDSALMKLELALVAAGEEP